MTQVTTFSKPPGAMAFAQADRADSTDRTGLPSVPGPGAELDPDNAALPSTVREVFRPVADIASAERYTRSLAHGHYENFSVVSLLLPRHLRQDFCNVYAFCRTADDLADEVGDKAMSLRYLAAFRDQTIAMFAGQTSNAIFAALSATVHRHDIPIEPFLDLIDAFEQDQRVTRYETFEQLVGYCRRSADPVGRLVLYMCGRRDEERQRLSDKTCTALQLANFWQDVRRDLLERDRIYLSAESMRQFGVSEKSIRDGIDAGRGDEAFRQLIRFEVERTEALFNEGRKLLPMLEPSVRRQISLFADGGVSILQAIRRQDFDTLGHRPSLSKWQKGRLICSAMGAALAANISDALTAGRARSSRQTGDSSARFRGVKGAGGNGQ